tara:strand:- start:485 stop:688 length:204 start_codon:yes stop_codon:yes gene_type:complete
MTGMLYQDVQGTGVLKTLFQNCQELLSKYEYDGDNTPFIRGSALQALEGNQEELGVPSIDVSTTISD